MVTTTDAAARADAAAGAVSRVMNGRRIVPCAGFVGRWNPDRDAALVLAEEPRALKLMVGEAASASSNGSTRHG